MREAFSLQHTTSMFNICKIKEVHTLELAKWLGVFGKSRFMRFTCPSWCNFSAPQRYRPHLNLLIHQTSSSETLRVLVTPLAYLQGNLSALLVVSHDQLLQTRLHLWPGFWRQCKGSSRKCRCWIPVDVTRAGIVWYQVGRAICQPLARQWLSHITGVARMLRSRQCMLLPGGWGSYAGLDSTGSARGTFVSCLAHTNHLREGSTLLEGWWSIVAVYWVRQAILIPQHHRG